MISGKEGERGEVAEIVCECCKNTLFVFFFFRMGTLHSDKLTIIFVPRFILISSLVDNVQTNPQVHAPYKITNAACENLLHNLVWKAHRTM